MPKKCSEAVEILEALESKLAYVPGGRDREGRPLIVVNVPPELQPSTKPELESLITYFLSIFSEETKRNGLILIVDARQGAWRVARSCIRLSMILLGSRAATVIVVRPDGFWDKRVDSCTKSQKESELTYLTLTRLQLYVEFSQLPYELGGSKPYDHTEWIQRRVKVEDYRRDALVLVSRMTNLHQRLSSLDGFRMSETDDDLESYWEMGMELTAAARYVLQSGRNLVSSMSRESAKDSLDTVKHINELLDTIELKQLDIENSWAEMERNLDIARVIEDLEKGVSRVTDWILGPADAMLNSCCQVGFDVSSSEELRRKHEELELECRETYGQYAELLHKIDSLPNTRLSEDLKSQRDFMDFVCRSFATRLERRRNVLITSQRFFRLVSEYFDKTSEVFDKLVMGNRTHDFSQASAKLSKLEHSQAALEALERELVKEGEKLSDILSMPVKDALGRDIHVDYEEDIINVRDILDATNARKNIFNDSVELQKLSFKQAALIYTYENDAEQAVKWLNDLYEVLLQDHMEIGCNATEIQSQKNEHQSFQETAKGTYDYGCQLVSASRVLRLSCRLPLESNANLFSRLRQAWKQLRSVGQEQLTRLRVCAVFHRNVENHCQRLCELIDIVSSLCRTVKAEELSAESRTRAEIRDILGDREKLLLEVGRMVRLGRLLRSRLKEPLCHQRMSEAEDASGKGSNLTAVEAISAKLAEVTRLAEKLDAKLCEAGARTRPVPMSSSAMSSSSSIFSTPSSVAVATSTVTLSTTGTTTVLSATSTSPSTLASISSSPSTIQLRPSFSPASPAPTPASTSPIPAASVNCTIGETVTSSTSGEATTPIAESTSINASDTNATNSNDVTLDPMADEQVPLQEASVSEAIVEEDVASICHSPVPVDLETGSNDEFDDKEVIERSFDENTEDSNAEAYVTATECSTTPTARSRSESFVTSPECEDLAAPATVTPTCASATWWDFEDVNSTTPNTHNVSSSISKDEEILDSFEVKKKDASTEILKPEVFQVNGLGPCEKVVTVAKTVEEKSGKIVKEVTETTTLRVSHDTRLGVTSYKVTSNTLQDHREHLDVDEVKNFECSVSPNSHTMNSQFSRIPDQSASTRVIEIETEFPDPPNFTEQSMPEEYKFITRITDEEHSDLTSKDSKDVTICVKEYMRRHEDSGIELSPTKREDNMEGQNFLERSREVSSIDGNVGRDSAGCCSCNCAHEAACFDRYSTMSVHSNFIGLTTAPLAHENQRRLPLPNPS